MSEGGWGEGRIEVYFVVERVFKHVKRDVGRMKGSEGRGIVELGVGVKRAFGGGG